MLEFNIKVRLTNISFKMLGLKSCVSMSQVQSKRKLCWFLNRVEERMSVCEVPQ